MLKHLQWSTLFIVLCHSISVFALSSLSKNDAFPMFSTNDPHEYLLSKRKFSAEMECCLTDKFDEDWLERGDQFSFSVTPFFQNADRGKGIEGGRTLVDSSKPDLGFKDVPLLDITGCSAMIPLVYGPCPMGQTLGPLLTTAQENLFPGQTKPISDENQIDPNQQFGFFSFPAKYKKRGVRFDMQIQLCSDFGLHAQAGFASICQSVKPRINKTCLEIEECVFSPDLKKEDVNNLLMDQFECIAKEIKLDVCDFQETSADEVRLQLYWRHVYDVNEFRAGDCWPRILVIPYAEAGFSFSPGRTRDTNELYGLGFGNNKHHAVGFTTGLNVDFLETIEIGGQIGYTHFFDRDFDCFRLPNNKLQQNLFPFRTSVNVEPGHNWHFAGKIAARHFLCNLSMFFQYVNLEHDDDTICLKKPDSAFVPEVLAKKTAFKTKVANIGFTYDFSPNFTAGMLWQAPLSQRNTYRNTTVMFGVTGYF